MKSVEFWDSGVVKSADSLVSYAGPDLQPHTRYQWRVRIWDQADKVSPWSEDAWFETGFLLPFAAWPAARWITASAEGEACPFMRGGFRLTARPLSARLYITARGLFEAHLNGRRIGRDRLTPGWTDYRKRIEYLTYDITGQLRRGANTLGVVLANGWYAGHLGWEASPNRQHYGAQPALLAVLRLVETDGTVRWLGTDDTWIWRAGPLLSADLYQGENYDARRELAGWSDARPGSSRGWMPVKPADFPAVELNGKTMPPVRAIEMVKPVDIRTPGPDRQVVDFGQNLVGVVRLRLRAPRGTRITLRHAEMLQDYGEPYTDNLRSARATDHYVARGGGVEIFEPRFTFHGFRYAEISGLPGGLAAKDVRAVVMHTEMSPVGTFETSNPLLNQLQRCIRWGQKGNFLEVPTDCPQRDERLGWTGDAQIFLTTASFNFDIAAFFTKWLRDLTDAQHESGAFPDVAPDLLKLMYGPKRKAGNAAWADAGVICPWLIYQRYGDVSVLGRHYESMVRWIDYQERTADDCIRPDTAFGDWLAPDAARPNWASTPCDLIGTAYFARTTGIMAQVARILDRDADASRFERLQKKIVRAFNRNYVTGDGRVLGDTQTAYLLALGFDLLPVALRSRAVVHLERALARRNYHLSTGFVGTPLLAPVLSRVGRTDLAYRLVLNETYPSWLFPVKNGATTMWERWNSWTPQGGFGETAMNSFNHYAYGAIGEWLYAVVGGIDLLERGFRRILLRPRPGGGLTFAKATLKCPHGLIRSSWMLNEAGLQWSVLVPPNTTAAAVPPATALTDMTINGTPWLEHTGVRRADAIEGEPTLSLVAGNYDFHIPHPRVLST
ncbi:MAG: family 78 glycoside hydrolase catalytic domain [Opitutaceae bacterium]